MNKSSIIVPLLLLSTLFHCFTVCSSVYRVFIRRCELASYFEGTLDFDAVKGRHVDIIRHGEEFVLSDGSLQLSTDDSDPAEVGSGWMPLFPTGNSLPTIPSDIDAVSISWHANKVVNYSLEIQADPEDHFWMLGLNVSRSGVIPLEKSGFQLAFECNPASVGKGRLFVNLTTVLVSTGENVTANFHLDKICEGMSGGGSTILPEPSVLVMTSPSTVDTTASLPATASMQRRPLSLSSSTTDSAAVQTTFLPSSFIFTRSPSLTSSDVVSFSSSLDVIITMTSSRKEDVFLMPYTTLYGLEPTSSSVATASQFSSTVLESPSSRPQPITSTSSLPIVAPTPSPSSSPRIEVATSSSIFSPTPTPTSSRLSERITSDGSPSSSSHTPVQPTSSRSSFVGVETMSPSHSPLPSPVKVNGTKEVDGVPRMTLLFIIVFAPVVGVLLFVICVLICCICFCACKKGKRKPPTRGFSDDPLDLPVRYSRDVNENELEESFSKAAGPPLTVWLPLTWGAVSTLPAAVQSIIKHYTVDRRSLSILSTVAREEGGAIVKGQWSVDSVDPVGGNKGVMMKMLTSFEKQYGHRDEMVQFVEQATLLRGRDHQNVQKVLKVSVEDNYIPLVVYPIVEYGNMHQFLTFCRLSPNESPLNPVTIHYKMNFALQIVSAMNFLTDEGIVHPDLALRNCLLDTGYSVKVSDGALSQLFFPECYSNVKGTVRPVRWSAIETLRCGQCISASNVWSYGVTVWEILTLGEMPYSDVDNNRSIPSSVMMGERLPQPPDCPDTLYEVLKSCWQEQPSDRLTFDALQSHIDAISGRYTPIPVPRSGQSTPASISLSRQSTPGIRREAIQHTVAPGPPQLQPQYVPVVTVDKDEDEVFGAPQNRKYSAESVGSQRSRDSLAPEKLSITFSVLSEDVLGGEGGGSSSESEGEGEEKDPEVLAPELLDRFMPSLKRDQSSGGESVGGTTTETLSNKPVLTLTSPSVGAMGDLEDTLRYHRLPNTARSPGPLSTSTMTSRLSPSETSSQYGHSTVRSDETPVPPISSPSPDLISKASTIGDETLSTASNPLLAGPYHLPGTGMMSKTSTLDSVVDSNHPSNLLFTPHLNGSQYNEAERQSNPPSNGVALSNGHPPGKANGDVIKPATRDQVPPIQNTSSSESTTVLDSKDATGNGGVVLRKEGIGDRQTSRESQLLRTSFGLGLGDLSSDLLSAFDNWS